MLHRIREGEREGEKGRAPVRVRAGGREGEMALLISYVQSQANTERTELHY